MVLRIASELLPGHIGSGLPETSFAITHIAA